MASSAFRTLSVNKQILNPALYNKIQEIWFSGIPAGSSTVSEDAGKRWFGLGSPEERISFDNLCTAEFGRALESISPANYPIPAAETYEAEREHWDTVAKPLLPTCTPEGSDGGRGAKEASRNALGLVILLDQMPRNIFREKQGLIYSHYDRIARSVVHSLLNKPEDQRPDLHPSIRPAMVERLWFYMPLMHSEYLEDHVKYDEMIHGSKKDAEEKGDERAVEYLKGSLEFEKKHVDILKKYGQYPHRNSHLGRKNTVEETAFLDGGGETFSAQKS